MIRTALPLVLALAAAPAVPARAGAKRPPAQRSLRARLDALWAHRDHPGSRARLEGLTRAAGSAPGFPVLWRLARMHCWLANARDPKGHRQEDAEACWHLGDRAARARPGRPEGHYWAAVGVGLVARARGIAAAFFAGLGAAFQKRLDAALHIDPTYDRCAPLLAEAQLYRRAPWPVKDLARAGRLVRKARRQCPDSLRARLDLAELELERGHAAAGRSTLEALVDATAPADTPEARRIGHLARERLERLDPGH